MLNLGNLVEMQLMLITLMSLGYFLINIGMINQEGKRTIMDLVVYVTLPCSIVKSFIVEFNTEILKNCFQIVIVALAIQVGTLILGKFLYSNYEEKRKKYFSTRPFAQMQAS